MKKWLLAGVSWLAMATPADADAVFTPIAFALFAALPAGTYISVGAIYTGLQIAAGALAVGAQVAIQYANRPRPNPQDIKNTTKGSEGPARHAFGLARASGRTAFGNTKDYNIYRLLLQCDEPYKRIFQYRYDSALIVVDESDGRVVSPMWVDGEDSDMYVHAKSSPQGDDTAFVDLTTDFPNVRTAAHTINGISHALLKVISPGTANAERFSLLLQGGIKELTFDGLWGSFYDPRDASTGFTTNGVLIALHYFRRLPGMTDSLIDFDDIAVTADQADVLVATKAGTAPRCQLSGGWEGALTIDIVQEMLTSAGLEVRQTESGKYTLRLIEDDPDSEITFLEQHNLELFPQAGPEGARRPNKCIVEYYSAERGYEVSEVPLHERDPNTLEYIGASWARIDEEIAKYGEQEYRVRLTFCPDASQAQRIARRLFYMARADFGISRHTFAGMAAFRKRTITIEIPDVGEDGASVFVKVRKGPARVHDNDGVVEIPFQIIPDELTTPWNPATMEVDPPPVLEEIDENGLERPDQPIDATVILYPVAETYQTRVKVTSIDLATLLEIVYRTFDGDGYPNAWIKTDGSGAFGLGVSQYGIDAADTRGQRADFKVRYFTAEGKRSLFSEVLTVDPMAIDNSTPAAPTVEVSTEEDAENPGDWYDTVTATFTDLHVAGMEFNTSATPGGDILDAPLTSVSWETGPFEDGDPRTYYARCLTSDGTPSAWGSGSS